MSLEDGWVVVEVGLKPSGDIMARESGEKERMVYSVT